METPGRGTDGQRRFSAEFKGGQLARVERQELTIAELSRELGIDHSVLRHWQHLIEGGSRTAVAADGDVVADSELKLAQQRIRELGRKTMKVEILQAARDEVNKQQRWYGVSKR